MLEFQAAPLAARASPAPSPTPAARPRTPRAPAIRTVVIDPGHGGAEVGAKGPAGTLEKDVTLAIARKVRANVANGLGLQAFLTRDRTRRSPLDDRAAFANNYKADLFVSIHANASRSPRARAAARSTSSPTRPPTTRAGGWPRWRAANRARRRSRPAGSDLALILWDMAQAEHLEESSALASRIQEELAEVTGSQGRGVKQAPFRVLVGAAMPAVLVEVAFISNAEEEKLLASDAYQTQDRGRDHPRDRAATSSEREQRTGAAPRGQPARSPEAAVMRVSRANVLTALGLLAAAAGRGPHRAALDAAADAAPCPARKARRTRRRRRAAPSRGARRRSSSKISVKLFFQAPDQPGAGSSRSARWPSRPTSRGRCARWWRSWSRARRTGLVATLPPETQGARRVRHRARRRLRRPLEGGGAEASRRAREAELLTVYSIVNSLTANFPAVKRVQILVDDRQAPTLAGHVDLTRPAVPRHDLPGWAPRRPRRRPPRRVPPRPRPAHEHPRLGQGRALHRVGDPRDDAAGATCTAR